MRLTRFLPGARDYDHARPGRDLTYLSSSLVREVARYGGDVSGLVHPAVAGALSGKFGR